MRFFNLRQAPAMAAALLACLLSFAGMVASAQTVSSFPVLRIMPLGDSITAGTTPGGYESPLLLLLTNAGFNASFVGTQFNLVPNEGHPAYLIDDVAFGLTNWVNSDGIMDVILLLIGTNDYGQNYDTPDAINRLDRLISEIVAIRPEARIVVANLLQRYDVPSADAGILGTFNPYVPGIVANHAALGQRVFFLDMESALGESDLSSDLLHPNETGYDKMATNWFGAISKIIAPNAANGQLVTFDGASIDGSLNFAAIPANYQPIPGLTIGYNEVGIYNGGPDHTSGVTGTNHYNTYSLVDGDPQVFTFSQPVAIPSVWLCTYAGGEFETSSSVTVSAYADTAGTLLLTNVTVAIPTHSAGSNYDWVRYTGLTAVSTNILNVQFSSSGDAQVDDMLVAPGPPIPTRLAVTLSGRNIVVSWPTNDNAGAILAESPFLGAVLWTPVVGSPRVVGAYFQMTFPSSGPGEFFKLQY